jgi:hypothetical protein
VIIDREPTSKFIDTLQRNQVFFAFAVDYNTHNKGLTRGFDVSPEVMEQFLRFLDQKKVSWTPADVESDKARLKVEIRQALFSTLWGMEEGFKIGLEIDRQAQRAIELFPEAQQLATLARQEKAPAPPR